MINPANSSIPSISLLPVPPQGLVDPAHAGSEAVGFGLAMQSALVQTEPTGKPLSPIITEWTTAAATLTGTLIVDGDGAKAFAGQTVAPVQTAVQSAPADCPADEPIDVKAAPPQTVVGDAATAPPEMISAPVVDLVDRDTGRLPAKASQTKMAGTTEPIETPETTQSSETVEAEEPSPPVERVKTSGDDPKGRPTKSATAKIPKATADKTPADESQLAPASAGQKDLPIATGAAPVSEDAVLPPAVASRQPADPDEITDDPERKREPAAISSLSALPIPAPLVPVAHQALRLHREEEVAVAVAETSPADRKGEGTTTGSGVTSDLAVLKPADAAPDQRQLVQAMPERAPQDVTPRPDARPFAQALAVTHSQVVAPDGTARVAASQNGAEKLRSVHVDHVVRELGIEIARHAAVGREEFTLRLKPAEHGSILVRMHFQADGALRAVVSAESPAMLDTLRRESDSLAQSLGDAGVRTDSGSFRFADNPGGSAGQNAAQAMLGRSRASDRRAHEDNLDETETAAAVRYRPLRALAGSIDRLA